MGEMCKQSLLNAASYPVDLLLVMSKLCRDFELSTVEYILTLTDEQFHINPRNKHTSVSLFITVSIAYYMLWLITFRKRTYLRMFGNNITKFF